MTISSSRIRIRVTFRKRAGNGGGYSTLSRTIEKSLSDKIATRSTERSFPYRDSNDEGKQSVPFASANGINKSDVSHLIPSADADGTDSLAIAGVKMPEIYACLNIGILLFTLSWFPQNDCRPLTTTSPLLPFVRDGKEVKEIEASGVEPVGDGTFIIADDRKRDLVLVDSKGNVLTSLPMPSRLGDYPKWEAMAKDGADYYVIGSHQAERWSHLMRFRVTGKQKQMSVDQATLSEIKLDLGPCKLPNLRIEGLAIRRRQLVVGLREDSEWARVCAGDLPAGPNQTVSLKPLFAVKTPKTQKADWHLAALDYVAGRGYLVLMSTEFGNNEFNGNKIWLVSDRALAGKKLPTSPDGFKQIENAPATCPFQLDMKAEGIAVTATRGERISVVIVFDNDNGVTGKPSRLQFAQLNFR
jgi:hypothetical protein